MAGGARGHGRIKVVELFAGVGGFRIGLERAGDYEVVWSNQWEPGKRRQHASDVYVSRFGADHHVCKDIAEVPTRSIPEHDLLVGGFPCQDYSVASTLKRSQGLVGRKGVLWWQIHRILSEKKRKPAYLLLENVDRLLGSPAGQRGRDLAVMLASLSALGYSVEWRVINAAEHGFPQRRKRVFIFGWRQGARAFSAKKALQRLTTDGVLATAFPGGELADAPRTFQLDDDLARITQEFNAGGRKSPFGNAGVMHQGQVVTGAVRYAPRTSGTTLGDVLLPEKEVPAEFFIPREQLARWKYLKGAKREARTVQGGDHKYFYAEGAMTFPEALDQPSRTVITGEGGAAPSRFKHVVRTASGRYRRLTPVELERLNMFPDGHTAGVTDNWRAFFMGNALVTGVVQRIGTELVRRHAHPKE